MNTKSTPSPRHESRITGLRPKRSDSAPWTGAHTNWIAANNTPNTPTHQAAFDTLPPTNCSTRCGSTGMITPKASTSTSTVTKMKASAARRGGTPVAESATGRSREGKRRAVYAPRAGARTRRPCGKAGAKRVLAPGLVEEAQELGAGARVVAEAAEHLRGHHAHPALVDAARGHALVAGLDHHAHAARRQHLLDALRDLRGHLFLHLEAARVGFHHARELADAHHLAVGQVAHVRLADDRCHVVLAVAFELDVAQHDHLVVAGDLLEGALEV